MKKTLLLAIIFLTLITNIFGQKNKPNMVFRLNLDSTMVLNEQLREISKGDSLVAIIDYMVTQSAPVSNLDSVDETRYTITMSVKKIKSVKFVAFKDAEVIKVNKEIEEMDKWKSKRIQDRDNVKKQ